MTEPTHNALPPAATLRATIIGGLGPLLWSLFATLIVWVGRVPELQMVSLMAAIGAVTSAIVTLLIHKSPSRLVTSSGKYYILGVFSICAFYYLIFTGFHLAPPEQVFIVTNLWPFMVVIFAWLILKHAPRFWHLAGVSVGLTGTILVAHHYGFNGFSPEAWKGLLAAFSGAMIWALYSTLSRFFDHIPTDALAGVLMLAAIITGGLHFLFEETVTDLTAKQWTGIILTGVTTHGIAIRCWVYGMQYGNMRALAVISYIGPILGALLLMLFGMGYYSHLN